MRCSKPSFSRQSAIRNCTRQHTTRFCVGLGTGIGIPPEQRKSIFAPFTQADNSSTRKYGGLGIGLTVSAKLIAMMGGSIWLDSQVGHGSDFHFTIHAKTIAAEEA